MAEMNNKLHEYKSRLEEAESSLRDMTLSSSDKANSTGPSNVKISEKSMLAFKKLLDRRSCAPGEVGSIEVRGADGSQLLWSCNRSK